MAPIEAGEAPVPFFHANQEARPMQTQENRLEKEPTRPDERGGPARLIGDVLVELFAQYQARFPQIHIRVVKESSTAA
jgi:hypothetical protein